MTRRQQIMNLTADLRARYADKQAELRAVEAEISECGNRASARVVRLGDRAWDLRAILAMIDCQIEARVDAFIAVNG